MYVTIPQLNSDTTEYETRAMGLLPEKALERDVAFCFECCLMAFLASLPKSNPYAFWSIDDFYLQEITQKEDSISLLGDAAWLEGGRSCKVVRIDIGIKTDPLLYSYKFLKGYAEKQTLYVAKTPKGWVLSDA